MSFETDFSDIDFNICLRIKLPKAFISEGHTVVLLKLAIGEFSEFGKSFKLSSNV